MNALKAAIFSAILIAALAPSQLRAAGPVGCGDPFRSVLGKYGLSFHDAPPAPAQFEGSASYFANHTAADFQKLIRNDSNFKNALAEKRVIYSNGKWLTKMVNKYHLEDIEKHVPYLSDSEKSKYLLQVKDGHIVSADGSKLADTEGIFVMDSQNHIYYAPNRGGALRLHHSSFARGEPVQAAGEIFFDSEGNIRFIGPDSGHYLPADVNQLQVVDQLKKEGLALNNLGLIENANREAFLVHKLLRSIIAENAGGWSPEGIDDQLIMSMISAAKKSDFSKNMVFESDILNMLGYKRIDNPTEIVFKKGNSTLSFAHKETGALSPEQQEKLNQALRSGGNFSEINSPDAATPHELAVALSGIKGPRVECCDVSPTQPTLAQLNGQMMLQALHSDTPLVIEGVSKPKLQFIANLASNSDVSVGLKSGLKNVADNILELCEAKMRVPSTLGSCLKIDSNLLKKFNSDTDQVIRDQCARAGSACFQSSAAQQATRSHQVNFVSLSNGDRNAIAQYKQSSDVINREAIRASRAGTPLRPDQYPPLMARVQKAILRLPPYTQDTTFFRKEFQSSDFIEKLVNLSKTKSDYTPGSLWSSTTDEKLADSFGELRGQGVRVKYVIDGTSARRIPSELLDSNRGETEAIFPAGCAFTVESVQKNPGDAGSVIVHLSENHCP